MGLIRVTVGLRAFHSARKKQYQAEFLVDTGATDSMAPASKLRAIGIKPIGKITYELADGTPKELEYGVVVIEFMGDVTAGRVTALESTGVVLNPKDHTLKRLPAIPLKSALETGIDTSFAS